MDRFLFFGKTRFAASVSTNDAPKAAAFMADSQRFDITGHDPDREPPIRTWRDDKVPLEGQATEIVRSLFLKAEEDARAWAVTHHRYQLEARATRIRDAKLAAERAEKERVARREAHAKERIQLLVDEADGLEQAKRIRRYVEAGDGVSLGHRRGHR